LGDAQTEATRSLGLGWSSFYPLGVGGEWTYEGGGAVTVVADGDPPVSDYKYAFTETHTLIGNTHHEGTKYVVEEQVHHEIPEGLYGPVTWYDRLREDRTGLYSLDTLLQSPPPLDGGGGVKFAATLTERPFRFDVTAWRGARVGDASLVRLADRVELLREAVHGVLRGRRPPNTPTGVELRRLVYPLRIGTSWSIRPDFPWPARVDRFEFLKTPAGRIPAFRIEINPFGNLLQEGEWVRVWYSQFGYLGYSLHSFSEGTNTDGSPSGVTYALDESMKVASIHFGRAGRQ
jgi:hypothetical protein